MDLYFIQMSNFILQSAYSYIRPIDATYKKFQLSEKKWPAGSSSELPTGHFLLYADPPSNLDAVYVSDQREIQLLNRRYSSSVFPGSRGERISTFTV
jgi:hypothetical protein